MYKLYIVCSDVEPARRPRYSTGLPQQLVFYGYSDNENAACRIGRRTHYAATHRNETLRLRRTLIYKYKVNNLFKMSGIFVLAGDGEGTRSRLELSAVWKVGLWHFDGVSYIEQILNKRVENRSTYLPSPCIPPPFYPPPPLPPPPPPPPSRSSLLDAN